MIVTKDFIPTALAIGAAACAAGCAVLGTLLALRSRDRTRLLAERNLASRKFEAYAEESSRQIQAFARIGSIIASSLERDFLLSQILIILCDYLPGAAVRILVYRKDGGLERIGPSREQSDETVKRPTDENLFTLIASMGGGKRNEGWEIILDDEARLDYAYNFPFIAEEEFKGSLVISSDSPLEERTRLFLGDIATLIASAHQNILTVRQKERINEQFGKIVDPKVRDHLLSEREEAAVLDVSVLFFDIRNFTARSEALGPKDTVAFLNGVFADCDGIVREHGGFINKFTGDGFMAVFGAPDGTDTHPEDAVAAALDMVDHLASLHGGLAVGIGIASGDALAGTIGSERRMEYTVIGDTVNTASRIEGLNKLFGTPVLVSGRTFERIPRVPEGSRFLGTFRLKGKERPIDVYGLRAAGTGKATETADSATAAKAPATGAECWDGGFARAVSAYYAKEFSRAKRLFSEIRLEYPEDRAVRWYLRRSEEREMAGGGADWDGIERLSEK